MKQQIRRGGQLVSFLLCLTFVVPVGIVSYALSDAPSTVLRIIRGAGTALIALPLGWYAIHVVLNRHDPRTKL